MQSPGMNPATLPANWDTMDKAQRHDYVERFNIMEFDGGLSEADAALEAEAHG